MVEGRSFGRLDRFRRSFALEGYVLYGEQPVPAGVVAQFSKFFVLAHFEYALLIVGEVSRTALADSSRQKWVSDGTFRLLAISTYPADRLVWKGM